MPESQTRVCLVGAGSIAHTHAEVLAGMKDVRCVALVEPNPGRAEKFAAKWQIAKVYRDLASALTDDGIDAVHILTPPDSHAELARTVIASGRHVLVEKPLTERSEDADALVSLAAAKGVVAAVNQNFVFHPAFLRLRAAVTDGSAGPLRDVNLVYNVPLRQLAARQFGAWMFHAPGNILLEQAVHPLSQIAALIGPADSVTAHARTGREIAVGATFHSTAEAIITAGDYTAHLQFAVGRAFPFWQVMAVCDDAVLVADILTNRFVHLGRGPGLEPLDMFAQSWKTAAAFAKEGTANIFDYALSLTGVKGRSDAFFLSMQGSIGAFHRSVKAAPGPRDARLTDFTFGAGLIRICEQIAAQSFGSSATPTSPASSNKQLTTSPADVVVLGGTGFIGSATTARLVAQGARVRVMARNTRNLAPVFHDSRVTVMAGDIGQRADVAAAVSGVPTVINLAHGGGGANWSEIERAMVGGTQIIAECCLDAGTQRLIHVGSIAGLYAGDSETVITGATPPDPLSIERADYARAKADADRLLLALHRDRGLPVCILRPGIVVGQGTSPFHSGLGTFNTDQHCIGWNAGRNPLPFVLVDDVADAIARATTAEGILGKTYNLVGDVRFDARTYIANLAEVLRRPLQFHPSSVKQLYIEELGKWLIKRAIGRRVPAPSMRDLKSRGLVSRFDVADVVRDLGWSPVADSKVFVIRAFGEDQ